MVDVRVRSGHEEDAAAVQRIARETWHEAYDDILGSETVESVLDDWYALDGLRESLADEGAIFLVATEGGSDGGTGESGVGTEEESVVDAGEEPVVGFAHAGEHPGTGVWHLIRIYVLPDRWGEGLGTALLEPLESALEDRGVDAYELAVLADNEVGVAFYEARGFDRIGTETVELGDVETTEYHYRKEL